MRKRSVANGYGDLPSDPVLVYDAKCPICKDLALKTRRLAKTPLRLVALSDPEAEEMLAKFYPDGWEHDFYFVTGSSCRRGVRALPRIMRTVGTKNFGSLAGEYAEYLLQDGGCGGGGDCDCGDHGTNHQHEENDLQMSRRSVAKAMSAATFGLPIAKFAGVGAAKEPVSRGGLQVHVARVRPDGDGGFEAEINGRSDLVRSGEWNASTEEKAKGSPVDQKEIDSRILSRTENLQVKRSRNRIEPKSVGEADKQAIRMAGEGDEYGESIVYQLVNQQRRFDQSFNVGRGPLVLDDETPVAGTTMSGRINHDIAHPVVDFVTFESPQAEDLATHLDAYLAGFRALGAFYRDDSDGKMAKLYAEIADGFADTRNELVEAVAEDVEPINNHIAISGVPNWVRRVESPSPRETMPNPEATVRADGGVAEVDTYQQDTVSGSSCDCSCCVGCCCGCDCGCSIGVCVKPGCGCGCCCGACGAGCGCGCCYCA